MKQVIACALLLSSAFFMASQKSSPTSRRAHYRSSSNESTTAPLIPFESTSGISSDESTAGQSTGKDRKPVRRRHLRNPINNNPELNIIPDDQNQTCEQCCTECCLTTMVLAAVGAGIYATQSSLPPKTPVFIMQ